MAEITELEPETTTVNQPLLSQTPATAPAHSAGGDRASPRCPMLLGLFAGRRGASLVVRENVALEMEDWQEDWGYSLPVVVTDVLWNLAFVVAAVVTLFWIAREERNVKLRVWICGYSMQCVVHVVLLVMEYRRRNRTMRISTAVRGPSLTSSSSSSENGGDDVNPIRALEWHNTVISYMWWVIGFTWMVVSYDNHGSRRLFWLSVAFLATDVFFLVLRSIVLCLLSAGYCFCLPCIIAFMYYINRQERASDADIRRLPKYIFEVDNGDVEQPDVRACRMMPRRTNGPDFSTERVLPTDEADCCICLCQYEDGEQLHLLPCNHHFHSTCISKWLRVKATCPVCKSFLALIEEV